MSRLSLPAAPARWRIFWRCFATCTWTAPWQRRCFISRSSSAVGLAKNGDLLPAIVQHAVSGEVLMLGYMNADALQATEQSGQVTFYSRSKQRLWTKGESSGHVLQLVSLYLDCDNDTLLILAHPKGPTCHNGTSSYFASASSDWGSLYAGDATRERKNANLHGSYTAASLYASGTKRIAQKVGEKGVETSLAAKVHDKKELTNEAADLVYHLLVLL